MTDKHALYEQAKNIARENLTQCCKEIVDWRKNAVLVDGLVRNMSTILENVDEHNATRMAEQIVLHFALEKVASSEVPEEETR